MLNDSACQSLETLLGERQVVTHPVELVTYERDAGFERGAPAAVAFPQSAEDAARLMRWANEHAVALIARGAGTGLSGGAVAERGGVIVEFARMNRVIELDARGRSAVVAPGMTNLALDELAQEHGLYYPPDPSSQRAATLGGNVAENAGGPHCFKYGVTTNYVTGVQVVLADGRSVRMGGRALDYPGYDFMGLIVGSEGTLALVTEISVRLLRRPPGVKTMMAIFDSVEACGAAVSAVIAAGLTPATMELMDRNFVRAVEEHAHAGLPTDAGAVLIAEVDGYVAGLDAQIEEVARILRARGGRGVQIARDALEREQIWYARKSAAGAFSRLAPAYYLVDITVPRSRLAETLEASNRICERYALRAQYVLHAGDGNLHPVLLMPNPDDPRLIESVHRAAQEMVELSARMNGSLTGEHGVGIEKRAFLPLMFTAVELSAQWDVKQVFDPNERLNPGKIFPEPLPKVEPLPVDPKLPDSPFTPTTIAQAARGLAALSAAGRRAHIGAPALTNAAKVVVSAEAFAGVQVYAPDDLYVTVGAGTRLADLQTFLARERNQAPIVSPWRDATIGGIVAANVNAPLRMRYGGLRDLVLALTVVLADGRVLRAGRPVVKNVAGYDLPKVFVGSRGALGLIADVTLKITPLPRARRTLTLVFDDLARGLACAARALPLALVASAIVLLKEENGYRLVYTAEGISEDVEAELAEVRRALAGCRRGRSETRFLVRRSKNDAEIVERTGFSDGLLEASGATPEQVEAPTGTDLWASLLGSAGEDALIVRVGVAPQDLADYVEAHAALLAAGTFCADVANGLVYAVATPGNLAGARDWIDSLRRAAQKRDGYAVVMRAPAEWRDSIDLWGYRPEVYDLMRRLKARWDPAGILD
jgi:D-lactate dehydrogenase (cytochrome)